MASVRQSRDKASADETCGAHGKDAHTPSQRLEAKVFVDVGGQDALGFFLALPTTCANFGALLQLFKTAGSFQHRMFNVFLRDGKTMADDPWSHAGDVVFHTATAVVVFNGGAQGFIAKH